MSMKPFFGLGAFSLALSLAGRPLAAAPLAPVPGSPAMASAATAVATPVPVSSPSTAAPVPPVSPTAKTADSPVAVSAPAEPLVPVAAPVSGAPEALVAPVSATADASGDSLEAEEVGEDGQIPTKTIVPDLGSIDSDTLATLSDSVDRDSDQIFFDPSAKLSLAEAQAGAWQIQVSALYYELAKRTLNDAKDKSARQALALALFKDPDRAKDAKDLAFDDKLADAVIAQVEAKKPKARMDLQALAEKGNRKARAYLGLDKPFPRADANGDTGTVAASTTPAATTAPAPVAAPATATAGVSPQPQPTVPAK
jgi:hypothetical protein